MEPLDTSIIREAVNRALGEDIGAADITTLALVPEDLTAMARMVSREPGIVSGLPLAARTFQELDERCRLTTNNQDGDLIAEGDVVLEVTGPARAILTAERVALNFIQQLSGIATLTHEYVEATGESGVQILDTRKTFPGLRALQKYAVRCGGGQNHRQGLYDAFMAKDNHISLMNQMNEGSPEEALQVAVKKMRAFDPEAKLIFEADTLEQVKVLASAQVDQILLDNMSLDQLRKAVSIVREVCTETKLEASGNMNLERIRKVCETGVDFISVGKLSHSLVSLDIGLDMEF